MVTKSGNKTYNVIRSRLSFNAIDMLWIRIHYYMVSYFLVSQTKVYSSKCSCIQKWSSVMTYIFRHCLWSVCAGLCNILNPYIKFYLSYERQKMVVSSMALHRFNHIIMTCRHIWDKHLSIGLCFLHYFTLFLLLLHVNWIKTSGRIFHKFNTLFCWINHRKNQSMINRFRAQTANWRAKE